jgi:hypothetical protein
MSVEFPYMTLERRFLAGLDDIKAVCFECNKCQTRIVVSADSPYDVPIKCEKCGHPWRSSTSLSRYASSDSVIVTFVNAIPTLRTLLREQTNGFRILLEFEWPENISTKPQAIRLP